MDEKKQNEFKLTWKGKNIDFLIPILIIFLFAVQLAFYSYKKWSDAYLWQRMILFFLVGVFFYIVRPKSWLHKVRMDQLEKSHMGICAFVIAVTCLTAALTMELSDWWSDSGPDYQFQYEAMTEAVLDGHLYLDLEVSPQLAAMDNPYDSGRRGEEGVPFYWDHAFYNGHYYMYFGVVPVFLLFVPLKILGISLYSYQATQIFVIFIILGMFAVFREITKQMCPEIPMSGYLAVSVATSWIAVWYAVKYPALYCTANTGGICMAVWGFYFCYRAFIADESMRTTMRHAVLGALFSALTFGCRPTIGFACLALVPLLVAYLKKCGKPSQFVKVFILFCIPFVIVAVLLMLYNYARFENPFEFGQSYQLTTVDQHDYSNNKMELHKCLSGLLFHFFAYEEISDSFPFIHHDGCFVLFPMLFIGLRSIGLGQVKKRGNTMIKGLAAMIILAIIIISFYHVTWAPIMFRRYSLDFYFLLGYLVMFGACGLYWSSNNHAKLSFLLTMLAAYTFVICFLLLFVAYDYSIADLQPQMVEKVKNLVVFWKK